MSDNEQDMKFNSELETNNNIDQKQPTNSSGNLPPILNPAQIETQQHQRLSANNYNSNHSSKKSSTSDIHTNPTEYITKTEDKLNILCEDAICDIMNQVSKNDSSPES